MLSNRKGFTLIELLIVVVIIGILAAIAIPKFAATKDKAKLASVKSDVRNIMSAQEAYFSDFNTYAASFANLQASTNTTPSAGNTVAVTGVASGFTITVTNSTISTGFDQCTTQVGAGAATTVDGVIVCS
ncbi:MAG: prepilin-type N-terminal cleavage/methylation domain-containing protein [Gemmatimonadales bacterium]|nr:prepilin-type N-terminal cleavage/methylation domain-containing protein [Gemmatimonadales bacterium]